ncbi:MAG: hypothetical protein IPK15_24260 [Verrucomicrobia bacterium]|nr:hypothetical protein [Verrucomicrobiota bacterium]
MMTNAMSELLHAADVAATRNDRWLFIAVLMVLGIVVFFAVRWLINKHEALMTEHRGDQQQYTTSLLNITADVNKTNRDLAVVLERNTSALKDTAEELRQSRDSRR